MRDTQTSHLERRAAAALAGAGIARTLVAGSLAGLATAAAVALRGTRERGSAAAPINATSHVLWGDLAATTHAIDVRRTLTGLAINVGAGVFWALVQNGVLAAARRRDPVSAVASGVAVAGLAYVVDYHVIPRRLSPGWELAVSDRSVALGFTVLGASLALTALLDSRR